MDIQSFVSEALRQIVAGVADAQTAIHAMEVGARVNPTSVAHGSRYKFAEATDVKFDLAVTVVTETHDGSSSKVGGSAGGMLAVVRARAEGELASQAAASARNEAVSRVAFSVMLAQPADIYELPPLPGMPSRYA